MEIKHDIFPHGKELNQIIHQSLSAIRVTSDGERMRTGTETDADGNFEGE